jgi:hypothetical protein
MGLWAFCATASGPILDAHDFKRGIIMACHEIAALRLSLMQILGMQDQKLLQHELAELGDAGEKPGPIRMLAQAQDWQTLVRAYDLCLVDLESRLSQMADSDVQRPYYQTLAILNKKIEGELRNIQQSLTSFFHDLEEVHDHMHVIYPGEGD